MVDSGDGPGRKIVNFRLTADGRRLLQELADKRGIAKSAVIELLIREEWRRDQEMELKPAA